MSLTPNVMATVIHAQSKALATTGPAGVHVVPVSMITHSGDTIWLFDFFMENTRRNIINNPAVALAAWTGMTGVHIKAQAQYVTEGDVFDEAVAWVRTQNPDRITKGLIILTPTSVHDVSPGGAFTDEELLI